MGFAESSAEDLSGRRIAHAQRVFDALRVESEAPRELQPQLLLSASRVLVAEGEPRLEVVRRLDVRALRDEELAEIGQSSAIKGNQVQSACNHLRDGNLPSSAIRGNQRQSVAIRGNQWQSPA